MTTIKQYKLPIILGLIFLTAVMIFNYAQLSFAGISNDSPTVTNSTFRTYNFFVSSTTPFAALATTTSATSTNILPYADTAGRIDNGYMVISGAKSVSFFFGRGGTIQPNTGSTRYRVQVSPDGSTWYDYANLRKATTTVTTSDLNYSFVSSATIVAATTTDVYQMGYLGWYAVRCIALETTDGEHQCSAYVEY